jgi:hypothetical protein
MTFIQVDPNQKKTVAVLVTVLVAAVLVIAIRIIPGISGSAASEGQSNLIGGTPITIREEVLFKSRQNPFKRPAHLRSNAGKGDAGQNGIQAMSNSSTPPAMPWMPPGQLRIEPIKMSSEPIIQSGGEDTTRNHIPSFTLLATVKSESGYYCVIKIDDSNTRVVRVNDIIANGFRVKAINAGRAILTDGKDTIIARKPPLQVDTVKTGNG